MPNIISKIKTPDNSVYDIKPTANPNINTDGVFYITSTDESTTSVIDSSLSDLASYYEGLKVVLHYTLTSASSTTPTLKINSLEAKSIRRTSDTDLEEGLKKGGMYHLVYDGSCFVLDGYTNTNSSSGTVLQGQGYGTCDASSADGRQWTALAILRNYVPTEHSVVAIYTTIDFYDDAYLNISNTGEYPVYYQGQPISEGEITANSVAVFMFQGGKYHLISGGVDDSSLDPRLYEMTANKVTRLSADSTNTQYPSAKCVYDMIGDIETLLADI